MHPRTDHQGDDVQNDFLFKNRSPSGGPMAIARTLSASAQVRFYRSGV